ncbi:4a-hydroxytetrahydrobiopterin dehydratase [Siculibacillus lacustris]|uniref:4a-hydroxytetrahydrobiopterin dehydratase n=1 Tax=Siculibacillus lacustris TaxID=1549641 RepID=A0A4V2KSR6_9HYPH|nr:4a-hydroxytetrahydrobiopterin dehydratase [Siculibacillus lacustris]TBW34046.1 4a-hydroxytetrahydrobiopterin dehydratase [Siculibacillus lacustris]
MTTKDPNFRPPEGWSGDATAIEREYRFVDFPAAIAFMVAASFRCEAANHHPDWTNVWNRLTVRLSTHDAGRVTDKDLALAAAFDALYATR